MSSIYRSRKSPYPRYSWELVDASLSGQALSQKKVEKGRQPKQQGLVLDKASLLEMLLDTKETGRPPASRPQPSNGKPRWQQDKDEFRLEDPATKGIPVRLSSADRLREAEREEEVRGNRWNASQWFVDGFDEQDRNKRTT